MQETYTLRQIASRLGLSRSVITGLIDAGFVTPGRGPRGAYRFSFQDMVLLRAAQGLKAAQISPRRMLNSLRQLRVKLPGQMPLTGLRLAAVGNEVVVRSGGAPWQADSGQWLFDFEAGGTETPAAAPAQVSTLRTALQASSVDWYERAVDLEATDRTRAEAAYRRAIDAAPTRADAYLNLGVLLGEAGQHAEAAVVYLHGIAHCPPEALLHFNLAVALEDGQDFEAAIEAYEHALALEPTMADAHFNLARLHDELGRERQAIRHYSAYRRLRGRPGRQ